MKIWHRSHIDEAICTNQGIWWMIPKYKGNKTSEYNSLEHFRYNWEKWDWMIIAYLRWIAFFMNWDNNCWFKYFWEDSIGHRQVCYVHNGFTNIKRYSPKNLITYPKEVRCTTIGERFVNLKHLFAISWREKHGSGILARVYWLWEGTGVSIQNISEMIIKSIRYWNWVNLSAIMSLMFIGTDLEFLFFFKNFIYCRPNFLQVLFTVRDFWIVIIFLCFPDEFGIYVFVFFIISQVNNATGFAS